MVDIYFFNRAWLLAIDVCVGFAPLQGAAALACKSVDNGEPSCRIRCNQQRTLEKCKAEKVCCFLSRTKESVQQFSVFLV